MALTPGGCSASSCAAERPLGNSQMVSRVENRADNCSNLPSGAKARAVMTPYRDGFHTFRAARRGRGNSAGRALPPRESAIRRGACAIRRAGSRRRAARRPARGRECRRRCRGRARAPFHVEHGRAVAGCRRNGAARPSPATPRRPGSGARSPRRAARRSARAGPFPRASVRSAQNRRAASSLSIMRPCARKTSTAASAAGVIPRTRPAAARFAGRAAASRSIISFDRPGTSANGKSRAERDRLARAQVAQFAFLALEIGRVSRVLGQLRRQFARRARASGSSHAAEIGEPDAGKAQPFAQRLATRVAAHRQARVGELGRRRPRGRARRSSARAAPRAASNQARRSAPTQPAAIASGVSRRRRRCWRAAAGGTRRAR